MNTPRAVVRIEGRGPVGMALALFLSRHGFGPGSIAIDPIPVDLPAWLASRSIALSLGSWQLLSRVAALPPAAPILRVEASLRGHAGRTRLQATDLHAPALGHVLRYGPLHRALADALAARPGLTGTGGIAGAEVALTVVADGDPGAASGDTVLVGGVHHRIVGVLAGTFGRASRGVVVPFQPDLDRSMRIRALRYPALLVHASRVEDIASIEQAVRARLAPAVAGRTPAVVVQSYRARAEQATQGILVFKLLMGAITGISLLVGGIGIMNVLLASVSERTREIGIRKVAGARHRDILAQFLTESVAITAIGSVLGVMLGLAGAFGVTALIRHLADAVFVRASFSWVSVLIAAAVTIAIGLAFGTYPARRAARLSPIDAIRHD